MAEKDYAETLFEAVEVLINKKIEAVKFDETINATIVDASKAAQGQYTVSVDGATFTAYSSEIGYKKNDAVMVTIPQGNYDNQKLIIGKAVDNNNTPIIYQSPFQSLVNISHNLISGAEEVGFWANNIDAEGGRPWDIEAADFINSIVYTTTTQDANNNEVCVGCWWDSGDIFEQGFTHLGLQAQFSTWLNEYGTTYGNYGLAVELTFKNLENAQTFQKIITFDSSEFFGDVYNFETYYTQENVYDLAAFRDYPIVRIRLFPYQRNNFRQNNGDLIYELLDGSDFSNIVPNIFIKDPYICLGISTGEFNEDTIQLLTNASLTYHKEFINNEDYEDRVEANRKIIGAQWIHKNDDGVIAAVQNNEIPIGYEVRWYRYKLGAPSPDEFAGAHWQRFYGCVDNLLQDADTSDWCITDPNEDIATNNLEIIFQPDVNNETEQLKAIIIYDNRLIAFSNILTFINDNEIVNQATIIDSNALSIRYEDDEKGHYFLYDEAGDIGKNEDGEIRVLTAVFDGTIDDVYSKALLNISECALVKWTFPSSTMNTMIVPMTSTDVNAVPADTNIFTNVGSVGFTIKKHLNNAATQNTITLEVEKDGLSYFAQIQPIFGTAGTNGSNYTVIVNWLNGKNAVNLSEDFDHILEGEIAIYDQSGNIVAWPADTTVNYSWQVAEYGTETRREKIKETADIYYPVFSINSNTGHQPLFNYLIQNPDQSYQTNDFYYFLEDTSNYSQYFTFDPIEDNFIQATSADQILYKKAPTGYEKYKLEFKEVVFETSPLNQETGIIADTGYDSPITTEYDAVLNKIIKKYSYSSKRRYFVKINDQYVLDPWETFSETETYYEPIESQEIEYVVQPNQIAAGALSCAVAGNHITITANNNTSMNSIFILQLTVSNFGDYDLVSYYPIALKNGETKNENLQDTFLIDYIEGPDRVRYSSNGEAAFNKNPYQITCRKYEKISSEPDVYDFNIYRHGYVNNINTLVGYWRILTPYDAEESNFDAQLIESQDLGCPEGAYNIPYLNPPSVYIPTATPYAIQFCAATPDVELITLETEFDNLKVVYNAEGEQITKDAWMNGPYYKLIFTDEEVLWTQPILVYENNYPSQTLNKWNGKDIAIDENSGTITASGFAAGKKERDNTFTGVVLGDWSRTVAEASITKNTGIYGFNHGSMSYAFKDDGTGFIGKDGAGRIYFNGNSSQIYSGNWRGNNELGLLLDIDEGYLKLQSKDNTANIFTRQTGDIKTRFFSWTESGKYVLKHGTTYYWNHNGIWELINDANTSNPTSLEIGFQISTSNSGTNPITLSGDLDSSSYILNYCKEYTHHTLNPFYIHRLFKDAYGYDEVGTNETYSNSYNYYLKEEKMRYITLGANQPKTPLSIGTEKDVQARRFRVDWDGTMHVVDGDFRGNITGSNISGGTVSGSSVYASYLEANQGQIGGWTIDNHSLSGGYTILHSSNGITTNAITITNADATTVLGTIGWRQGYYFADGTGEQVFTNLLGIAVTNSSTANGAVIEVQSNQNIRLSGIGSESSCHGIYLVSEHLSVSAPAANQSGIYARFA